MFRRLMFIFALITVLLVGSAAAQDAVYIPGENVQSQFIDAFLSGKIVKADVQIQIDADPAATGMSDEDAAVIKALNNAKLTVGAGLIEDGLRIELGAAYAGAEEILVDAAANITKQGLLVESSLLEGESVSSSWEILLALAGLSEEEIQAIMLLRDTDLAALAAQLIETAGPYLEMAVGMLAPYGETIAAFAGSLPMEISENVPADDPFPAAAQEIVIAITAKDIGALLTQLADQLEADQVVSMMLTMALAEQSELPFSTTAELCAAVREAAAQMTDTEHPLILFAGIDETGMPLYLGMTHQPDAETFFIFNIISAPTAAANETNISAMLSTVDGEGMIIDGVTLDVLATVDPANPYIADFTVDFAGFLQKECVLSMLLESVNTAAEGELAGYTGEHTFSMSVADAAEVMNIVAAINTHQALTADGGETITANGTMDLYSSDISLPLSFSNELIFTPGADGPRAVYTETASSPEYGLESAREIYTLYTENYDPAATAALANTSLETATTEDMNALFARLKTSATALLTALSEQLPPEAMALLTE